MELFRFRQELVSWPRPAKSSEEEWELRKHKLVFARFDQLIDLQPTVRHLQNPEAANIVRDALYHFAGERYDLIAYVVMPSHFHWVFHPRREWVESLAADAEPTRTPRERIM